MGLTLTEKILKNHLVDGEFIKGSEIGIKIDQTLTQDATGTMAYLEFEAIGIPRVKTERSVAYIDHNTLQNGFENADDHRFIGSVAKKHGICFSRPGNGICHRLMPFYKLLRFLLSMYKTSSQTALNQFFEKEEVTMSQQALSKARNKFDHSPFVKLYTAIRDAFYAEEHLTSLRRYCGKLIIAIDGSETVLPNLPALREKFGGTGSKASSPTARMSIAYDVLDDIIIDADFSPLSNGERAHAMNHIENVGNVIDIKDAIFIMDRGYACEELIRKLYGQTFFLFRLRSKFNTEIDALPLGSHLITMYGDLSLRIVKFELPSGEIETLLTNLFDIEESEFKELYFKRWPVEVKFDIVKNKLELPNFGGFTENIILQDFWISMYLANMAAIVKNEADEKIKDARKDKNNKYEYQANVNTLIGSLRERLADAVFSSDPNQRLKKLDRVMLEIQRSVVPFRPDDGSTPRYQYPRKSKFHHNKKSNL